MVAIGRLTLVGLTLFSVQQEWHTVSSLPSSRGCGGVSEQEESREGVKLGKGRVGWREEKGGKSCLQFLSSLISLKPDTGLLSPGPTKELEQIRVGAMGVLHGVAYVPLPQGILALQDTAMTISAPLYCGAGERIRLGPEMHGRFSIFLSANMKSLCWNVFRWVAS